MMGSYPFQLLFCLYVYKSIRHMENENQLSLLDLGVSCLMGVNGNEKTNNFELTILKVFKNRTYTRPT